MEEETMKTIGGETRGHPEEAQTCPVLILTRRLATCFCSHRMYAIPIRFPPNCNQHLEPMRTSRSRSELDYMAAGAWTSSADCAIWEELPPASASEGSRLNHLYDRIISNIIGNPQPHCRRCNAAPLPTISVLRLFTQIPRRYAALVRATGDDRVAACDKSASECTIVRPREIHQCQSAKDVF
ncbi:hypothetical protein J6590_007051 [Homalodisca vitripennis]|nr:hypothetical protein J6590_007051 [Homalodisca vitripennis]